MVYGQTQCDVTRGAIQSVQFEPLLQLKQFYGHTLLKNKYYFDIIAFQGSSRYHMSKMVLPDFFHKWGMLFSRYPCQTSKFYIQMGILH